jgi:archaellum component FlaF (FlaF/FlaG flagellin family)
MKGAFIIIMLIALLIVGGLVIKNMTSEVNGVQKMETVQKAKETVEKVNKATDALKEKLNSAGSSLTND